MFDNNSSDLSALYRSMASLAETSKPFIETSDGRISPCFALVSYSVAAALRFAAAAARSDADKTSIGIDRQRNALSHVYASALSRYADNIDADTELQPNETSLVFHLRGES